MFDTTAAPHEAVYLLADHLDAALAAGEDLLATRLPALADLDETEDAAERELARFISRLGRLESVLVGRLLQARRRLAELPRQDSGLKAMTTLFNASTGLLLELVERFREQAQVLFDVGNDRLPFLRDRGLLARDAAGLPLYDMLVVNESYRVGAVVELGPLMDMIAGLLDLLDRRYELYGDDAPSHFEAEAGAMSAEAGEATAETAPRSDRVADEVRFVPGGRARKASRPSGKATGAEADGRLTAMSLSEALDEIERPS